jgi:hypothetical protein
MAGVFFLPQKNPIYSTQMSFFFPRVSGALTWAGLYFTKLMKCTGGVSNFTSQSWIGHWGLVLGIFNGSWFWKHILKGC